jgi:hypothetical protein
MLNRVSVMPVLFARARSTSVSVGTYVGVPIRLTSLKKLPKGHQRFAPGLGGDLLAGAVHEVKLARVVEDGAHDGVLPHLEDGLCDLLREDKAGRALDFVLCDLVRMRLIPRRVSCAHPDTQRKKKRRTAHPVGGYDAVDADLAHGGDDGLCAVEDVLVYDGAVGGELLAGEPVLVDYFHLLDDGRLARLA